MRRPVFVWTALLPLALASCTEESSEPGLILSMSTDMIVPRDVQSVGIYIQHLEGSGRVRRQWTFSAAPIFDGKDYVVRFPATLTVASRKVGDDRLRTRVVAFTGDPSTPVPLVMREARTAVPTDRAAVLRLPLLWINAGTVADNAPGLGVGDESADPFSRFDSDCPPEQTRGDSGECESIDVPLASLPDRSETPQTACFDVTAVFGPGADLVRADAATVVGCSIPLGASFDPARTQVALVAASGYEVGSERVRPLPRGAFELKGSSVALKPRVCAELGKVAAVLVSQRATDATVETICSPWTEEPDAIEVAPPLPVSVKPDPSAPDAGPPDAGPPDAGPQDAGPPDAGPPTEWALEPDLASLVVGASGIYVSSKDDVLYKYPLTPGPARLSALMSTPELSGLGVDAQGRDVLFGGEGSTLSRIDPDSLLSSPVELCIEGTCRILGTPELTSVGGHRVLRGGDDRLYYLVSEPVPMMAPHFMLVSSKLDGSDSRLAGDGLVQLMDSPPTTAGAFFPAPDGVVFVSDRADGKTAHRCTATGCSGSGLGTSPSSYRAPSFYAFSPLANGTVYGAGGWDTVDGMGNYSGVSGIIRIMNGTFGTIVVPNAGTAGPLVRSGDRVCWHAQGTLSCMDGNYPATKVDVPGVTVGADLAADATYIYWTDAARARLQRRLWSTLL